MLVPDALIDRRYRVVAPLGQGGMADVQRVIDTRDGQGNRELALKRLTLTGDKDARRTLLFEREYMTLAGLDHPRIIRVFDYGVASAPFHGPYYTMELLDGVDLRELAPLSWRDACRCLRDIASSLALMHAQRVVHRDLTPRNIRLTRNDGAKLLDFGAISAFGTAEELIGTPPFVPPEALHGLALDQRADVFGLGATAYWVLTKQHAFAAARMSDLAERWTRAVPPVTERNPDVPSALSELIASMLSLDPTHRPSSMAVVIDQLTAIGDLPAEPEQRVATSYLRSAPLVGRDAEMRRVKQRLERARVGRGGVVLVEGAVGTGKTRLLAELLLAAKLSGFAVARAQAHPHQDPYALARSLADALLGQLSTEALQSAAPHVSVLRQMARRLPEELRDVPGAVLPTEPREQRGVIQDTLRQWIAETSQRTPLALVVDDIQHADEPSLALIGSLARYAPTLPLLILCTHRVASTESVGALSALTRAAIHVPLGPLTYADTERLMEALFGDVPELRPLASAIHQRTGGNPQQALELAEHLVRVEAARYVDGSWQLPRRLDERMVPNHMDALVLSRLPTVSTEARALLQSLSVCRGAVDLSLCATLAAPSGTHSTAPSRQHVFAWIGELVAHGLLVAVNDRFAFAHEPLRAAVYAGLDQGARALLHGRVAEALRVNDDDPAQQLEAGWHLLHAARELEGAELLERAGVHFAYATDGVALAVPALEAALDVYQAHGRKPQECLRLMVPLATSALYLDHRVALKHVPQTFALLHELAGFSTAERTASVSHKVALGLAFGVGAMRHLTADSRTRLPSYRDVVTSFAAVAGVRAAVALATFNVDELDRTLAGLEPLTWRGPGPGQVVYEFAAILRDVVLGREQLALQKCLALQASLDSPSITALPEGLQRQWRAGLLNTLGLITSLAPDDNCLQYASALEALGSTRYQMYAAQIRMVHHAIRGEGQRAEVLRRSVEAHAIQEASTWRMELIVSVRLLTAYALSGDVSGLKRVTRVFERYARDLPSVQVWVRRAQRAWHAARLEEADADRTHVDDTTETVWLDLPSTLMRVVALNRAGQHGRAAELANQTLSGLGRDAFASCAALALVSEHAVAAAHAGAPVTEATAIVDGLIAQCRGSRNPLLTGIVFEARARIALVASDTAACHAFAEQAEEAFSATDNPLLSARARSLHQHVGQQARRATTVKQRRVGVVVEETFARAATAEERAQVALTLIATYADVLAVALFVLRQGQARQPLERFDHGDLSLLPNDAEQRAQLTLEALLDDDAVTAQLDAPETFVTHSLLASDHLNKQTDDDNDDEVTSQSSGRHACTVIPLVVPGTDAPIPVAVAIVVHAPDSPPELGPTLVHALATGLRDA